MFGTNKVYLYLSLIMAGISLLGGGYYAWKKNIEHAALIEYNRKQMEQSLRDQEEYAKKQRDLITKQIELERELQRKTEALQKKMQRVDSFLSSDAAKKNDRPSSVVLKNTIEELKRNGENRR